MKTSRTWKKQEKTHDRKCKNKCKIILRENFFFFCRKILFFFIVCNCIRFSVVCFLSFVLSFVFVFLFILSFVFIFLMSLWSRCIQNRRERTIIKKKLKRPRLKFHRIYYYYLLQGPNEVSLSHVAPPPFDTCN